METNMEVITIIPTCVLKHIAREETRKVTGNQKIRIHQISHRKLSLLSNPG
jgi:hypothetical protein